MNKFADISLYLLLLESTISFSSGGEMSNIPFFPRNRNWDLDEAFFGILSWDT